MKTSRKKHSLKTNAFELLMEDHKKIKDLCGEFEAAPDAVTKQQIAEQVLKELSLHTAIEEELFYPAARGANENADELVDEALVEHEAAKAFAGELQAMSPTDEGYDDKFRDLAESVTHHAEEEESELFPEAQEGDTDWDLLGEQMRERKLQLQEATQDHIHTRPLN